MVELIDKAEQFAPQTGAPVVVEFGRLLAVEPDRSRKAPLEKSDGL
jgi:hypothetical protein